MYYLNIYEINGVRLLGGIFHSIEEQERFAEMALADEEGVTIVAKIKVDVDKTPVEIIYL